MTDDNPANNIHKLLGIHNFNENNRFEILFYINDNIIISQGNS